MALDAPARGRAEQAVHRQPVRVAAHAASRSGSIDDLAAGDRAAPGRQPVRPRVQQRDAHRLALRHVGGEAAALAEQLLAPMAQRAADHAGGRHERGLEPAVVRRRQRQRGEALDRPFADHVAGARKRCSTACSSLRSGRRRCDLDGAAGAQRRDRAGEEAGGAERRVPVRGGQVDHRAALRHHVPRHGGDPEEDAAQEIDAPAPTSRAAPRCGRHPCRGEAT